MPGSPLVIGTPPWGRPGAHYFADMNGDAGLPTRLQKTPIKGKISGAKSEGDVKRFCFRGLDKIPIGVI